MLKVHAKKEEDANRQIRPAIIKQKTNTQLRQNAKNRKPGQKHAIKTTYKDEQQQKAYSTMQKPSKYANAI